MAKANVCSWICVAAWKMATIIPTMEAKMMGGAEMIRINKRASYEYSNSIDLKLVASMSIGKSLI